MNKLYTLIFILIIGILQVSAQKKARYFGRKVFIGYEHALRPFGLSNREMGLDGFGLGKIKLEKLAKFNRSLGISYEEENYVIRDEYTNYGSAIPPRHLKVKSYSFFLKGYRRSKGIAPIGNYSLGSITVNKLYVREENPGFTNLPFGYVSMTYELGKTFPILGRRLIGDFSVGLNLKLANTGYFTNVRVGNQFSNEEVVQNLFGKNVLRFKFGISYALF